MIVIFILTSYHTTGRSTCTVHVRGNEQVKCTANSDTTTPSHLCAIEEVPGYDAAKCIQVHHANGRKSAIAHHRLFSDRHFLGALHHFAAESTTQHHLPDLALEALEPERTRGQEYERTRGRGTAPAAQADTLQAMLLLNLLLQGLLSNALCSVHMIALNTT